MAAAAKMNAPSISRGTLMVVGRQARQRNSGWRWPISAGQGANNSIATVTQPSATVTAKGQVSAASPRPSINELTVGPAKAPRVKNRAERVAARVQLSLGSSSTSAAEEAPVTMPVPMPVSTRAAPRP